ncbi:MAG: hypothetical protein FRX49_11970 [Trebouxia sp. A1-2]|nr:MAG: hypothetical protein FRX49_11970 [Trebouxia sp. A1-2]
MSREVKKECGPHLGSNVIGTLHLVSGGPRLPMQAQTHLHLIFPKPTVKLNLSDGDAPGLATARMAARTLFAEGLAKTCPETAADSIPSPTYPACPGS